MEAIRCCDDYGVHNARVDELFTAAEYVLRSGSCRKIAGRLSIHVRYCHELPARDPRSEVSCVVLTHNASTDDSNLKCSSHISSLNDGKCPINVS